MNSDSTSQETLLLATKPNRLILFEETVAIHSENHMEHIDALCRQDAEFQYVKADGIYNNH
jgi:hypothetical protein